MCVGYNGVIPYPLKGALDKYMCITPNFFQKKLKIYTIGSVGIG